MRKKLCAFAEEHPVLALLAAVVVLSLVVGCHPLVEVRVGSATASNAVCKTLPSGDRSIPLREMRTMSTESTVCMVN